MKVVQVVFPVLRGTRRFHIEKGRRWSIIEHLLLDAVCRQPASAASLADKSGLPRRVIVEAFIRLMRAGWVEIKATASGPVFLSTPMGAVKAPLDQLPAATVTEPKWRGFAIEQVTGGVFRSRELDIRTAHRLPVTTAEQIVVHLQGSPLNATGDLSEVFTAIEGEDELIVGLDRGPEKLSDRYAVVSVREQVIEGLPSRAHPTLRTLILAKAREAIDSGTNKKDTKSTEAAPTEQNPFQIEAGGERPWQEALYEDDDLILDGEAHKLALDHIIQNASERLIIHSTFISDTRARAILPALLHAAAKGVAIDILWGQDDAGSESTSSKEAAAKLQAAVAEAGRGGSITVHPFSTNSHAKVVFADNGKGGWVAIVGSCNWLAADFESFETSIRLRDPLMIGDLIRKMGGLSRGRPGVWHSAAVEMAVLGRRIAELPSGKGRKVPMRMLFGSEHARLVLEARDHAKKRIFVLSHRVGISARPVALLPTLAAIRANGIDARFFYGRTTGPLSGVAGADLTREFAKGGLTLSPVHKPRLHAKVFGWDDDVLAVSSLNWLSSDPADAAPYREIGVLLKVPQIADNFLRRFELARDY